MPGKHRCDVLGCSSHTPNVKCFHFPSDKARYDIWEKFCQNPSSKQHKFICAKHFAIKHFINGDRSRILLRTSNPIPTLEHPDSTAIPIPEPILSLTIDDSDVEVDDAPPSPLPSVSCSKPTPRNSSSFSPPLQPLTFSWFL